MNYNAPIEFYKIIEDVVDSIRETANITAITADGNNFRYTAANTLVAKDYISLTNGVTTWDNKKVVSADSTGFVLKEEFTATSFKAKAPYYMHEKESKSGEVLTAKTKQDTYKYQKYPLVLLVHPYTDTRETNVLGYTISPTIYIITNTNQTDWSDDRYSNTFEPILFPLYNEFLEALSANENIKEKYPNYLEHDKTDLLFIDGNPFPDKMDGLNLSFNNLEILVSAICTTTTQVIKRPLTISIEGDGETSPAAGSYQKENGTTVQLLAAENSGSEFVEWIINSVSYLDRVVSYVTTGANDAKAYFQKLITGYYQDVFKGGTNDIYKKDNKWYARNVGTALTNADPQYTDTQTLRLSGLSNYIETGVDFNGGEPMDFTTVILPDDYFVKQTIFFNGGDSILRKGILIKIQGGAQDKIRVFTSDGTSAINQTAVTSLSTLSQPVKINFSWAGDSSPMTITYNDGEASETITNIIGWVGSPYSTVRLGRGTISEYYTGLLIQSYLVGYFNYYIQDSRGTNIKDYLGLNDGTLIGAIQTEAWGTKNDNSFPALLYYGYEQYESDTVAEQYIYVIRGINGFFTPVISGYTKIKEIEASMGFSDTGNKILQPIGDTVLNQVSQDYGLPFYGISESDPQKVSYRDIIAIDLSSIPPEDFRYTGGDTVTNMQTKSS